MAVAGAVPITNFSPAQQAQLRAGQAVGNYQVLNGHVMDTRTTAGKALLGQRTANQAAAAAPASATTPTAAAAPTSGATGLPKGGWMNPSSGGVVQPPPQPLPDPDAAAKLASQRDALALIRTTLAQYGLPDSLADWAWGEIVAGKGATEVMLDLRQRPEFKAEFPEIDARQKAGLTPISPSEIISYRDQATQLMRAAGLPAGFFDSKQDFADLIGKNVGLPELADRITNAANAAFNAPADLRAEAASMGMGPGDLTAAWLNPDVAEPLLQRQWTAAQLSVAGRRSGWGGLSVTEATDLAQRGVTADQAAQGFGDLQQSTELFQPLDGSNEASIGRQDQLAAVFGGAGSPQAQQRIERRRAERKAAFAGSGGFGTSSSGVSGLGSAPQ